MVTIPSTNSHIRIGCLNTLNFHEFPDKHLFIMGTDRTAFWPPMAPLPFTKKPEKSKYDMRTVARVCREGSDSWEQPLCECVEAIVTVAHVGGARFWRVDPTADYGALDKLAAHKAKTGIIVEHWDDLLRLAGSLKLGFVQAGGLMRTLQTNDRPTRLARALEELGRIVKTLYLLTYIDDDAYRRRILTQLNRGEGRHQLARVVFHGKRGELRQRYREGQEDQLGALGLVVNAIILWNTIYMDAALDQLRREGFDVRDEDMARLSPLSHEHINMLGRYAFILPEPVARGELRPLRSPAALSDDDA